MEFKIGTIFETLNCQQNKCVKIFHSKSTLIEKERDRDKEKKRKRKRKRERDLKKKLKRRTKREGSQIEREEQKGREIDVTGFSSTSYYSALNSCLQFISIVAQV